MHGPTFMANPLATRIAHASTQLLLQSPWQTNVAKLESRLSAELSKAEGADFVEQVRVLGGIGVIEMKQPVNMAQIQSRCLDLGIWLRPFGKLVYIMPPYNISDQDLTTLTKGMVEVVTDASLFQQ